MHERLHLCEQGVIVEPLGMLDRGVVHDRLHPDKDEAGRLSWREHAAAEALDGWGVSAA